MDIFGIGPLELIFILVIMLIVLGPEDMVKTGRTLGLSIRKLLNSPLWRTMQNTTRDLTRLSNTLLQESGLEGVQKDFLKQKKVIRDATSFQIDGPPPPNKKEPAPDLSAWTTPQPPTSEPLPKDLPTIAPPRPPEQPNP